jgi:hypothetical protein
VNTKLLDFYRKEWPRVAAVQAMALGGASLLAGRKNQANLRALAVMNAMTMCAHQYEEYVDPGYFPGMVNVAIFKSDQPSQLPVQSSNSRRQRERPPPIFCPERASRPGISKA